MAEYRDSKSFLEELLRYSDPGMREVEMYIINSAYFPRRKDIKNAQGPCPIDSKVKGEPWFDWREDPIARH